PCTCSRTRGPSGSWRPCGPGGRPPATPRGSPPRGASAAPSSPSPPRGWTCTSRTRRRRGTPGSRPTRADRGERAPAFHTGRVAELTLGSFNLHMGRGPAGHDAPFYDVVTACKEIDTDVLVLQEAWVPDGEEGDVLTIASALGYTVAATWA